MMDLTEPELRNRETFSAEKALLQYSHLYLFPSEERIFHHHFSQPGTLLDIGCGCGRTSFFLQRMGHTVTGIDIVPEMLNVARKLVIGADFSLMDACELEFANESFDYVLFSFNGIDCIFPAAKRTRCLHEIHRVLKPNHPFVFSTHNALSLKNLIPTNRFRFINWLINIKKGRFFRRYRIERHPSGILEIYVTTPQQEKSELREIGFNMIRVYGQTSDHPVVTHFLDTWSYYFCRKVSP